MQPFQSEEVIERGIASIAAALNQRSPSDATINAWKGLFSNENAHLLAVCFRRLVEESEKFPPPRRMRSLLAEYRPSSNPAMTHVEGTDRQGNPCWFWSDMPKVPAYRAPDCLEGRACLERLRQLYEVTRVRGRREERACRAELQAQKVQLLKGNADGSSHG